MRLRIGVAAALGAQLWAVATPAQAHTIHRVPRSTAWTSLVAHGAGTAAMLLVVAASGGVLTAAALARRGSGYRPSALTGAVAAGATVLAARVVAGPDPLGIVHAVAAAVWVGSVVNVVAVWPRHFRQHAWASAVASRFAPVAIGSAVVTVLTGVWNARRHVGSAAALTGTAYGHILLVKLVVVALALGAGWTAHRRRSGAWFSIEVAGLAGAVLAASLLLAVPVPFRGTTLVLGEVTPTAAQPDGECASRHLGHLLAVREVNALHPGAVRLRTATSARTLAFARGTRALLSACEGGLRGVTAPVPSFGAPTAAAQPTAWPVGPGDGAVGEALARFFLEHRIETVTVVADASARATALVDGLTRRAPQGSVRVVAPGGLAAGGVDAGAVVVATDWNEAASELPALLQGTSAPARGTYLAPWLLVPSLLQPALRTTSGQVTVASSFDPQGAAALHYLAALARYAPGQLPSGPGFLAYLEARVAMVSVASGLSPLVTADREVLRRVTSLESAIPFNTPPGIAFFAPTRATILPPSLGHSHAHSTAWLRDGQLAAISGLVPLSG